MTNATTTETKLTQVQAVGLVPTLAAAELIAGDVTIWNFGSTYQVGSVKRVSARFVEVVLINAEGGEWVRRMRDDRRVPVCKKAVR